MQSRRCTPPKARLPYAHGSPNSRRRPKPCRRFRQAISYSDLPCKSECICAESGGIRGIPLPYAQAVQRHAGLLLFGTFSFKERKSTPFPLIKGKSFIKSPVCLQIKNILFALRFFYQWMKKRAFPCLKYEWKRDFFKKSLDFYINM